MESIKQVMTTLTIGESEEMKTKRQATDSSLKQHFFDKYGFEIEESDFWKVKNALSEKKYCDKCKGLPCEKEIGKHFKVEIEVKAEEKTVIIRSSHCHFFLKSVRQARLKEQFKMSQIPLKYLNKKFSEYRVEETNAEAVNLAKDFLQGKIKGLLLYGEPGRGKTLLASIIAQEYLKAGKTVLFGDTPSLLEDLIQSYSKTSKISLEEKMESIMKADLLILDDLGTEKATEWSVTRLYLIINDRYNANKPLIVTSNYRSGELAEKMNKPKDAAEGVTGSRIVSRLVEMCKAVKIGGKDRRLNK